MTSATPGEKGGNRCRCGGGVWICTTFPPSSWNCRPTSASSLFHSPSGRTVVALRAAEAAAARSAGNSAASYPPATCLCECMCVRVRECAYMCSAGETRLHTQESAPLSEPKLGSTFHPLSPPPMQTKSLVETQNPSPTLLSPSHPLLPNSLPLLPRRQELATFDMPRAKVSNRGAPAPPALCLGSAASPQAPGEQRLLSPCH